MGGGGGGEGGEGGRGEEGGGERKIAGGEEATA